VPEDNTQATTMTGDAAQSVANRDGQQAGAASASKTFTQQDLDRINEERLGRERQKYADYDTVKAELTKIKQSQMSDLEKLTQTASEHERRAIAAESRIAQTEIKADFVEKAIQARCNNVRLAFLVTQADGLLGAYDPIRESANMIWTSRRSASGSADGGVG